MNISFILFFRIFFDIKWIICIKVENHDEYGLNNHDFLIIESNQKLCSYEDVSNNEYSKNGSDYISIEVKWGENTKRIVRLPVNFKRLEVIKLNNCNILEFPDVSNCKNLNTLDLSCNKIKCVWLNLIPISVKRLNLSKNNLKAFISRKEMKGLEYLDLSYNNLERINLSFLLNLKDLKLPRNPLNLKLNKGLESLSYDVSFNEKNIENIPTSLVSLDIQTMERDKNPIKKIKTSVFWGLSYSRSCKQLKVFQNLRFLSLKYLEIGDLNLLSAFTSLENLRIESIKFESYLHTNLKSMLECDDLEMASLVYSRFRTVLDFSVFKNLESLEIGGSEYILTVSSNTFHMPDNLKKIRFENVMFLADDFLCENGQVEFFSISNSKILTYKTNTISKYCLDIELHDCDLYSLIPMKDKLSVYCDDEMEYEEIFDFSVKYSGTSILFKDFTEEVIDLTLNNEKNHVLVNFSTFISMKTFSGCLSGSDLMDLIKLPNLTTLSLYSQKNFPIGIFSKSLKTLRIFNSPSNFTARFVMIQKNISTLEIINSDIYDISFLENLKNLEKLILSNNMIEDISHVRFPVGLTYLDLSNNPLIRIESSLRFLFKLEYLNIFRDLMGYSQQAMLILQVGQNDNIDNIEENCVALISRSVKTLVLNVENTLTLNFKGKIFTCSF